MKKPLTMSIITVLAIVIIGHVVPALSQEFGPRCPYFNEMTIVDTCAAPESCEVIDSGIGQLGQLVTLQCVSTSTTKAQPFQFTFIAQRSPLGSFTFEFKDAGSRAYISPTEDQAQACVEAILDAADELGCY